MAISVIAGDYEYERSLKTISIPYPSDIQAGDMLAIFCINDAGSSFTTPAGWTAIGVGMFYKVAIGTESGSIDVAFVYGDVLGICFRVRGIKTSDVFSNHNPVETTTNTVTIPTGVNLGGNVTLALFIRPTFDSITFSSTPSGFTTSNQNIFFWSGYKINNSSNITATATSAIEGRVIVFNTMTGSSLFFGSLF